MNLIVTFFQNMTIDTLSKIVQISFYIVVGLTAVLTYISAKKGLLNTVNTEYQKKVINRLEEISKAEKMVSLCCEFSYVAGFSL